MKERPILFSGPMVKAILEGRKTQTRRVVKPQPCDEVDHWPNDDSHLVWDDIVEKPAYHVACGWCPFGRTGNRLWVRESFAQVHPLQVSAGRFSVASIAGIPGPPPVEYRTIYKADGEYPRIHFQEGESAYPYRDVCLPGCQRRHVHPEESWNGWARSIHMPRWASRITLEITKIRVERLQDVSNADARAEGVDAAPHRGPHGGPCIFETGIDQCFGCSYRFLWNVVNGKRGFGWEKNPWVWVIEFKRVEATA